jgi:hypothetical protein
VDDLGWMRLFFDWTDSDSSSLSRNVTSDSCDSSWFGVEIDEVDDVDPVVCWPAGGKDGDEEDVEAVV